MAERAFADAPGFEAARGELLRLLADSLFGAGGGAVRSGPEAVFGEADRQTVLLTAFKDADPAGIPEGLRREISARVRSAFARNLRIACGHSLISSLLEEATVPHVIIKGVASGVYYPDPALRQLGDVDFYVKPEDTERCGALLLANGFTPVKLSHGFHHVYDREGCRYEMHFAVPGEPEGEPGEKCRAFFSDMLARSELRETPFGTMRLPSAFHHGLILLLHSAHHLTGNGLGLRHLCDWAVFAASFGSAGAMDAVLGEAERELGLYRFASCLTDICARYLGCPVGPPEDYTDHALSDALLDDLFESGNFGQKDLTRSREAYLITSGAKNRTKLGRAAALLSDMVRQKWPLSARIRPLVPLGFAYFGAVYAIRVITGKKPGLRLREAVRGAGMRTELYDRLGLFE